MIEIKRSANGASNGAAQGREHVAALVSPHPLGRFLPALYQEDEFTQRWTSGLDEVLAPIFSSLDNFGAYLDPLLAPPDFLDWLGNWMGLVVDETWPVERRRMFVAHASALYRMRGTPAGLAEHVRIFTGGEVEIVEHGATAISTTAGAAMPGSQGFDFTVRVTVEDPTKIDGKRLDALVAAAKPAHLVHKVEVVGRTQQAPRQSRRAPAATAPTDEVVATAPSDDVVATETPAEEAPEPPADGAEPPPPEEPPT